MRYILVLCLILGIMGCKKERQHIQEQQVDLTGTGQAGEVYFDSNALGVTEISEFKSIFFIAGDDTYEINAEGLRDLSSEEAQKVAVAIQLLSSSFWTKEMTKAIIETFISERFKVEKGD